MKTSNAFIARQCDQADEVTELDACIASGQVSAAQVEAHYAAGDLVAQPPKRFKTKELINCLRHTASKGVSVWGDLQMAAADEIEILAAEVEAYASAMDRMTIAFEAALATPPAIAAAQPPHSAISNAPLQLALGALKSCQTGGYRDIDGDWCERSFFDLGLVERVITELELAIAASKGGAQ